MMKQKYAFALGLVAAVSFNVLAQKTQALPKQEREHVLIAAAEPINTETLSGIYLRPAKGGNFQLDFTQQLKEDATLEIRNTAGQVVFRKPIAGTAKQSSWRFLVGKLKPGIYLIEVKTSDTNYWTKFKVGR